MSIIVTTEPTNLPPRVLIEVDFSAETPDPDTAEIVRIDSAGTHPVRSAEPATLTGGTWVGYDYEAPFSEPVTYRVTASSETVVESAAVSLPVTDPWLIHPLVPSRSVRVAGPLKFGPASWAQIQRTTRRGVFAVSGRTDPVIVTGGARSGGEGALEILCDTRDDVALVWSLLDDEAPLLLRLPVAPIWDGLMSGWLSVGDVQSARRFVWLGHEQHTMTLPVISTRRPAGAAQAQWTWADVVANHATWQSVIDTYPTWADLVAKRPVGNADA